MPTTILLASSLIFRSPYGPALKICLLISVTTYVINIYKESEERKMLLTRIRLHVYKKYNKRSYKNLDHFWSPFY